MSFTDYTGLVAEVGDWLDRADLTASIPGFVALCESRLNRLLRVRAMEKRVTLTATGETVAVPVGFKRARSLFAVGTPNRELQSISADAIPQNYSGASGEVEAYALIEGFIYLAPPPASSTDLVLTYYEKIPALTSTAPTNWLLTRHPDAYFYGTLLAAEAYLTNDARLPIWSQAFDNVIAEIQSEGILDRYGVGIRMRSPIANLRGCRT